MQQITDGHIPLVHNAGMKRNNGAGIQRNGYDIAARKSSFLLKTNP
jgi:hypothetical protein